MSSLPPMNPPSNSYAMEQYCPKCGRPTNANGYCAECASSRITKLTLLFCLGLPVLGFGACLMGLGAGQWSQEGMMFALILMVGGPVVGLIYLVVALILLAKNR